MITQRQTTPEQMDHPEVDRGDLDRALRFIRAVNHRLGGVRSVLKTLKRCSRDWPDDRPIQILDIGTGSADIPLAIARWADRTGRAVSITAVDNHPTTLALAREHIGERTDITLIQSDALGLLETFEPKSFDHVHAGMMLHHLNDLQAMTVLRAMQRLANRGIIWNDLLRGTVGRIGVRVITAAAPAIVRHDARVSVDAGFTKQEALDLASRVGLEEVKITTNLWHRFVLTGH